MVRFVVSLLDTGIWRNRRLSLYFGRRVSLAPLRRPGDIHVGWGRKPSGRRAVRRALRRAQAFQLLEDGFLRSVGLSAQQSLPLSLVMDEQGIYYDATQPSRLEHLICSLSMTAVLQRQAERALAQVRRYRLSKYNHAPEVPLPALSAGCTERVLVVDQTFGDMSVTLGGADAATFQCMLAAAIEENPQAEIVVKTHPDVVMGVKRGYLSLSSGSLADEHRVRILSESMSPLALLQQVDKVYVVSSQMGFEGLVAGKPVVCFGLPWYAGWGLTDDRNPGMAQVKARRRVARTVEELFAAAYLLYPHYLHPAKASGGDVFDVIEYLARNKTINDATRGTLFCVGLSIWKRAVTHPFLKTASSRVRFVETLAALKKVELPADARLVIWGVKGLAEARAFASEYGIPLWRMEDGFLRSVGLGSDLFRPISLVVDAHGMYYDPASGSDLERMLMAQTLDDAQRERARRFRQAYVASGLSKYNLGREGFVVDAQGKRVILVPGQVEDDASIMLGSPVIRTNQALLEAVRASNPDAYIVYKPHPDVVAGNRVGSVPDDALSRLADRCVLDVNIIDCIIAVDEVHTMTSLTGFEALLHGRAVHCYGGPFYAGWGLTTDHFPLSHRTRRVSLDELVYAAMLEYPRYVLPGGHGAGGFVSAEDAMAWMAEQTAIAGRGGATAGNGVAGWWQRKQRKGRALLQLSMDALRARWQ